MPKHRHRRRTMKGGFLDTLSSWGSSFTQGASSLWGKSKEAVTSATSSLSGSQTPTPTPTPTPTFVPTTTSQSTNYGGRTRRRRMRGGYRDNISTTNLAADAAPFSGPTAEPHNWVGGRTRRIRRTRRTRRRTYRKH